jgi:DNA-binding MarR family transcriptional regulator
MSSGGLVYAKGAQRPPFVAGLLRMTYQVARRRQLQVQLEHGFTDLTQAHLNVLVYPPPDGVRPTELAERCFMTKQAMNYLLGELEDRGYIERRSEKGRRSVLIYLTRRGWRFFETQWVAMRQLEDEWGALIGKKQFDEFLGTLRRLSSLEMSPAASAGAITSETAERRPARQVTPLGKSLRPARVKARRTQSE